MTANGEMTNAEWAVEATARAMYIAKHWKRQIHEPDGQRKPRETYNALAGRDWDAGLAGYSMYQEFRMLAEAAVPAARPAILADLAEHVEAATISRNKNESDADYEKRMFRFSTTEIATWIRAESARPFIEAYADGRD